MAATGSGQSLQVSFGPAFTRTRAVTPVVNGKSDFSNTDYVFTFSYEHFFKKPAICVFGAFTRFDGYTFILFEPGGFVYYGNEIGGTGFSGVTVSRFDAGVGYPLVSGKRKFFFSPFVAGGLQVSKKTGVEIYSELLPVSGPNYVELEPISADPRPSTQLTPSLGFRTGFVFWKRLTIGLTMQGVLGFKPYQKMYLVYEYKGVEQPVAEYEADGTGLFATFGIGYRFAKWIK